MQSPTCCMCVFMCPDVNVMKRMERKRDKEYKELRLMKGKRATAQRTKPVCSDRRPINSLIRYFWLHEPSD